MTAAATGVGPRTIYRIMKELRDEGKLSSPERKKRSLYKPLDDFDESAVRNKIHEFYNVRRQLPTLSKLHSTLKEDIYFPGSKSALRKIVRKLGFSWKKTRDNRKVLVEKTSVVALRLRFYPKKLELESAGYKLVYVDETWVDTAYCAKQCWQSPSSDGVLQPCNRGQRLIVVHAGSRDGFIEGAQLIYKASSTTGDYHKEMNGINFSKWVQEKLLPNLSCPCAMVMDNASYHSVQIDRCPTSSSRKNEIKDWLRMNRIAFREDMLRVQLLEFVRIHKPPPTYAIDEIIRRNGHEILRLPPYHPDFNAIEVIWSQLKSIIRQNNVTFRLDDVHRITIEAFGVIGVDRWRRACDHVDKIVHEHKTMDCVIDERLEPIIIELGDSSDDSDHDSSTDTASETE